MKVQRPERRRLLPEVHDSDRECTNEADGSNSCREPKRAPIDALAYADLRRRLVQGHGIADVPQAPLRVLLETALHQHAVQVQVHDSASGSSSQHSGQRVGDRRPDRRRGRRSASRRAHSRTPRCPSACRRPVRAPARGSCRPAAAEEHALARPAVCEHRWISGTAPRPSRNDASHGVRHASSRT